MALYSCQTLGLCLKNGVDFSLPLLQAEEEEEEEQQQQEPHQTYQKEANYSTGLEFCT